MSARTGIITLIALVAGALGAQAQVLGTFTWQMQPYCNRVTLTIVQQGAEYQLVGSDDQCGSGPAPVTGSAVPSGGGVGMGLTITLPTGRAAHVSTTVSLASVSGPWTDGDGNTGTFTFNVSTGGSPRPAPAGATAIVSSQLSPAIYGGTGAAATVARSDHEHDARYYTKGAVDSALATKVTRPSGTGQVLIGPEAMIIDGSQSVSSTWFHDFIGAAWAPAPPAAVSRPRSHGPTGRQSRVSRPRWSTTPPPPSSRSWSKTRMGPRRPR